MVLTIEIQVQLNISDLSRIYLLVKVTEYDNRAKHMQ